MRSDRVDGEDMTVVEDRHGSNSEAHPTLGGASKGRGGMPWRTKRSISLLLLPGIVGLGVTFVVPLVVIIRMALNVGDSTGRITETVSLETFTQVLTDQYYWSLIGRTLYMGLVVTILTVLVSYPIALFLARTTSRWRGVLLGLAIAPLIISAVARTYGWMAILGTQGLVNESLLGSGVIDRPLPLSGNMTGIVISMTEIMMPYAILGMMSGFGRLSTDLESAASLLGAGPVRVLLKVTVPLSLPGIFAGGLLVFVITISSFITPQLMGGGRVNVLAIEIYNQATQTLNWPLASALSIVLLVVFGIFVAIYQTLANKATT
jgi:putative spermidine/putrescine transport system permease protein